MQEPYILTASVFFWQPGGNAARRGQNEERRQSEVADWFRYLGMEVHGTVGGCIGFAGEITAEFSYRESCGHVYRHLSVTIAGERSNLTTLRKLDPASPGTRAGMLRRATNRRKRQLRAAVNARLQAAA